MGGASDHDAIDFGRRVAGNFDEAVRSVPAVRVRVRVR
jgi:hypothetical protein